jgi:hypothetical protein
MGLPLEVASRQFYAAYLTIGFQDRKRVASFNTECVSWAFTARPILVGQDGEGLGTDNLVLEVFLESDDNLDGPDSPGILVLTGSTTN